MRYLNSFGVVVYKLFLLVTILAVGVLTFAPTASAYVLYDGDTKSDPNKPWTWSQQEAPWSNNTWMGSFLGSSGCMIHSMTQILIKSGTVKKGYTPADFVNEARASGFQWGIDAGKGGLIAPRLDIPSKGKIVSGTQVGTQGGPPLSSISYDNIRDNVKSGKEYIFHVTFPGQGGVHWMATDYVDKNNTLHIIDSGSFEGQDSTLMKALNTIGTYSKTNPSAYTEFSLKEGSWQTIDKNASVGGSETKTDDSKKDTAKSTDKGDLVPEDELTGMPDRNDYKAQGSLQLPGEGGYGAPDDSSDSSTGIDPNTKSDVQALKDANDNRIQAANSSLLWSAVALVGIVIFLYGCIILPMAFMFDRANTVFMFSMVSAVTFGRMRQMPVGMSEDELPKDKKGGYLTTKRLLVTIIGCFAVAALILSGAYRDQLLNIYYRVMDFFNNGGFGGDPNNMPSKG